MKQNSNNNRNENSKQRYDIIVRETAKTLGGWMMTTAEALTLAQLEKLMVKIARDYVRYNIDNEDENYTIYAESADNEDTPTVLDVEAYREGRKIVHNVYDFTAATFTTWRGKKMTAAEIKAAREEVAREKEEAAEAEAEMNQIPAEEVEPFGECTTRRRHCTAARVRELATVLAEAVGVTYASSFPASDMAIDCDTFDKWAHFFTGCEYVDPAAPFFFAIRKQGSESGTRQHCRERCKVLGHPVYVLKVEREERADLFTLYVRVYSPTTGEEVARAWEDKKNADRIEAEREANKSAEFLAEFKERETAAEATDTTPATSEAEGDEITAYIVTRYGDAVRYFFISEDKAEAEREAERMNDSDPHNTYNVETCTTTRADLATLKATQQPAEPREGSEAADSTPATSEANSGNENEPQKHSKAAPIIAAALFLLSLTIGNSKPAHIYTTDPAAVLAEVAAAGEVVTAYDIANA